MGLSTIFKSTVSYLDELIVVDLGFTDEIVAIAENFGVTIHHSQWSDNFAAT